MKAGIITIGDELLIGQTVNTNLAWLGKELSLAGISIYKSTTIRDTEEDIIAALDDYLQEAELIILTGGLGPTNDDITKATLTQYFNTELVLDHQVLERVRKYFESQKKKMLPSNILQAHLPKDALIIDNKHGTASGMWFEKNGKIIISLPGVPYEMQALITEEIIPRLKASRRIKGKYFQTLMIQGIGESYLAEKIKSWENRIYKDGLHLAYLPSPGLIKLRLTSDKGIEDAAKVHAYLNELKKQFPEYIYGMNDVSIFSAVGDLLKAKHATLGTVESCTGGGISRSLIQYPGSSSFFLGSLVTYSNELKVKLAHVSPASLVKYGAVSEEVAKEMATGGKEVLGADYVIAVTGIAGPSGGTDDKPVGTVWIAIASPKGTVAQKFLFGENRGRNIEKTELYAVNLLRKVILNIV